MTTSKATFGGIDILRFVAAAMVMLYHYGFWVWAFPKGMAGRVAGSLEPHQEIGAVFNVGWVGVPIFFVISGFIIAFSAEYSTPSRFFEARVKRLAPAAWICAPVTIAVLLMAGMSWPTDAAVKLVRTALFVPFGPWADSVYWTLGVEIAFYAIIWTLLMIGRFHLIESVAILIGTISTLFWVVFHAFGLTSLAEGRVLDLLLIHHGCFFGLGVMIWLMHFKAWSPRRVAWSVLFAIGGIMQIVSSVQVRNVKAEDPTSLYVPIVIFLVALLSMIWSLRLVLPWSGWRKIGLMTYPLYLLHNVVGAAILGVMVRNGASYMAAMISVSTMMVAASWVIAHYLEPPVRLILKATIFRYKPKPA